MSSLQDAAVSVIVPCYNSLRFVDTCFSALGRSTHPPDEIIAVDDASTDGTPEHLEKTFPNVRVIRRRRNGGFARAVNTGMRAARSEMIALLNVDTVVAEDWLGALVTTLQADPTIGILGCRMTDAEGCVRHDGGTIDELGLTEHFVRPDPPDEPFDVPYACGAGVLYWRELVLRLNGFDEGFSPMYFEDADLCARIRTQNYRVCSTHKAVMRHDEANDTGRETPRYQRRYHTSRVRYVIKHAPLIDLLWRYPRAEANYFLGGRAAGFRKQLLRAYATNAIRLPAILASKRRKVV